MQEADLLAAKRMRERERERERESWKSRRSLGGSAARCVFSSFAKEREREFSAEGEERGEKNIAGRVVRRVRNIFEDFVISGSATVFGLAIFSKVVLEW